MQRIIFRKGLNAQLSNIVLDVGNPGYVTDTRTLVVGDGSSNPPRLMSDKSTGDFNFQSVGTLTMPGGLSFTGAKPGAIGPLTPARMVNANGILAYRGLDVAGQDTWGNVSAISSDSTLNIVNGNGSQNSIDFKINPDSEILKNIIRSTINIDVGSIAGINDLINQLINAAITPNDTVHYGVDTSGSANTIVVASFDNPISTAIPVGTTLAIKIANRNTGPTTANFGNVLGTAIPVVRTDGTPLKQSDLVPGIVFFVMRPDNKLSIVNYNPTQLPLRNSQPFFDSTTFIVPEGCYFIFVRAWGGGGGGGNSAGSNGAGTGGGGGAYSEGFYFVSPGQSITMTVGLGGSYQTAGGTTTVGSLLYATGGGSGYPGVNTGGYPAGVGGTAGGGQLNISGGDGGLSYSTGGGLLGGGLGGASPFGGSVPGITLGTVGANGLFPGGGANGGAAGNNSGIGAKGLIIVSF